MCADLMNVLVTNVVTIDNVRGISEFVRSRLHHRNYADGLFEAFHPTESKPFRVKFTETLTNEISRTKLRETDSTSRQHR